MYRNTYKAPVVIFITIQFVHYLGFFLCFISMFVKYARNDIHVIDTAIIYVFKLYNYFIIDKYAR